jgi:hypothetical protein
LDIFFVLSLVFIVCCAEYHNGWIHYPHWVTEFSSNDLDNYCMKQNPTRGIKSLILFIGIILFCWFRYILWWFNCDWLAIYVSRIKFWRRLIGYLKINTNIDGCTNWPNSCEKAITLMLFITEIMDLSFIRTMDKKAAMHIWKVCYNFRSLGLFKNFKCEMN